MLSICCILRYNDQLSALRSDLRSCKRKTALQQKQIAEQQKQIAEQQKQTLEYANRLDDYDKKNEETSRKFQTLLQVSCPVQCFIFDIKIIDLYIYKEKYVSLSLSLSKETYVSLIYACFLLFINIFFFK